MTARPAIAALGAGSGDADGAAEGGEAGEGDEGDEGNEDDDAALPLAGDGGTLRPAGGLPPLYPPGGGSPAGDGMRCA